jgi:type I restriction enzyme S subunit
LDFLDDKCAKIDQAVKIKEDQIVLLRERRQIIIQEAVTRGLNPAAPMKDSGIDWIGQIPAHWDLQPMRAFFRFRNEKNDPVKTENILSLSIAHGVTPYSEEGRGGNKRKDDLTAYKLAYPGDIVLNSMNVIVGAVGRSKYFGAISPVYYAFYPVGDHVYVPFYEQIFLNAGFQRGLLRLGKGILIKLSGTGQLNTIRMKISTDDLKGLLFPTPPQDEQLGIVKYISEQNVKIDNGIAIKVRQIAALKEYKTSLINAAVTGKIKVI